MSKAWEDFAYPGVEPRDSVSDEIVLENIRGERDRRLAATDWTQLPDAPVDAVAWAVYRQALRDMPQQGDPRELEWPTPPTV